MNEETQETQESLPWLSKVTDQDEEDSIGEVIRYTLDELKLA